MTTAIDIRTLDPARTADIALRGLRVSTRLAGLAERTTVEQTFANRGAAPLEPIYTFPLPDGAAVCGFEVITGDRVLTGIVDESTAIQERYEEAVDRGDGAYLLEHERDDVFTVRAGALKPGQVATLRIEYVRELTVVDRHLRFELPTTLAPRYASGAGMDPLDALLEADAVNPPKSHAVPYGLSFEAELDLGRAATVSSPTHAIRCEQQDGLRYRVALRDAAIAPDRSIVLDVALAGEDRPQARAEHGPDGARYVSVSFLPELPETVAAQPADVVFVVDCSGSMGGESIAQARNALELCLRSLKHGDRFQIVRFGSTHEALTHSPVRYDARSLAAALKRVRSMEADLGGTELLACLRDVLGDRGAADGPPRQVLVLTDGQVSNEDATIALARDCAATHRIFTFGIGPAASQTLVHGLARVTGGAAEFVAYGERIEDKVLRTFSRLDAPRVEDVTIDFGGVAAERGTEELPPVFDGDALLVHARCPGELPRTITLGCRLGGEPQRFTVEVPATAAAEGALPRLWARQRIRVLEDQLRGTPAASRFTKSRDDHRTAQLVALSRTFGIVCSRTGFVAIEHRTPAERAQGSPELQRVPVMMPVGWGAADAAPGLRAAFARPLASPACSAPPAPSRKRSASLRRTLGEAARSILGSEDLGSLADAFAECSASVDETATDGLFALLALQTADGDFADLDGTLPDDRLATLRATPLPHEPSGRDAARARATLVALAVLERDHADRRAAWRRAAQKARAWLRDVTGWDDAQLDAAVAALSAAL
ncbi:MAG: VWA domain-containing protein [Planctomycetes bacterium]|nr:VWA domain-containing protein [Planctomycetota bacterium]